MGIHVMINWQLQKKVSAGQCHMTVSRDQVYNSFRWRVIRRPVIGFKWSQDQVQLFSFSKKLYFDF